MIKSAFKFMGQKCPKKIILLPGRAREGRLEGMGQKRPKTGLY